MVEFKLVTTASIETSCLSAQSIDSTTSSAASWLANARILSSSMKSPSIRKIDSLDSADCTDAADLDVADRFNDGGRFTALTSSSSSLVDDTSDSFLAVDNGQLQTISAAEALQTTSDSEALAEALRLAGRRKPVPVTGHSLARTLVDKTATSTIATARPAQLQRTDCKASDSTRSRTDSQGLLVNHNRVNSKLLRIRATSAWPYVQPLLQQLLAELLTEEENELTNELTESDMKEALRLILRKRQKEREQAKLLLLKPSRAQREVEVQTASNSGGAGDGVRLIVCVPLEQGQMQPQQRQKQQNDSLSPEQSAAPAAGKAQRPSSNPQPAKRLSLTLSTQQLNTDSIVPPSNFRVVDDDFVAPGVELCRDCTANSHEDPALTIVRRERISITKNLPVVVDEDRLSLSSESSLNEGQQPEVQENEVENSSAPSQLPVQISGTSTSCQRSVDTDLLGSRQAVSSSSSKGQKLDRKSQGRQTTASFETAWQDFDEKGSNAEADDYEDYDEEFSENGIHQVVQDEQSKNPVSELEMCKQENAELRQRLLAARVPRVSCPGKVTGHLAGQEEQLLTTKRLIAGMARSVSRHSRLDLHQLRQSLMLKHPLKMGQWC